MLHKIITPAVSLLLICAVVVGAQTLTESDVTTTTQGSAETTTITTVDEDSVWHPRIKILRTDNSLTRHMPSHNYAGQEYSWYIPEYVYEAVLLNPREGKSADFAVGVYPPSGHRRSAVASFDTYRTRSWNNLRSTSALLNLVIHSQDNETDLRPYMYITGCRIRGDTDPDFSSIYDLEPDSNGNVRETIGGTVTEASHNRPWETPGLYPEITLCSLENTGQAT